MKTEPILVLESMGKTGRQIVEHRARLAVSPRGTVPGPPRGRSTRMIPTRRASVLEAVKAVYVRYYPDLSVAKATIAIQSFTDLAACARFQRLRARNGRNRDQGQQARLIDFSHPPTRAKTHSKNSQRPHGVARRQLAVVSGQYTNDLSLYFMSVVLSWRCSTKMTTRRP